MNIKQSFIFFVIIFLLFTVLKCSYFSTEEVIYRALKEKVERGEKEVLLSEVTTFEWDTAYFSGHNKGYYEGTHSQSTDRHEFLLVFKNKGKVALVSKYSSFLTPLFMYSKKWESAKLKGEALSSIDYINFANKTEFSFSRNTKFKIYLERDKVIFVPQLTWDEMDYL